MDALLLGRRTYEIFANYWPTAPEEIPFTSLLNGVPKCVASRTLAGPLDWRGSTVVSESIAEGITSLKERHDEVHVIGSLNLVQSLLRFGLVDRWSGCTRFCWAAASRCSPTGPGPPRCV